ncbi:MAG: hypothetical protein ACE5OS_04685 [Anaerolineae bacterium]
MARQKAMGYVLDHVSDHMGGDEPSLVIDGERFYGACRSTCLRSPTGAWVRSVPLMWMLKPGNF